MSEETTKTVATAEEASKYINDAFVNGELIMRDAKESLGWTFPRIRSKALTIAKKLNGIVTKRIRGVYFLETSTTQTISETTPEAASVTEKDNG